MKMKSLLVSTLLVVSSTCVMAADKRLPIIDMHLHASKADGQGPPPLAICPSPTAMPAWDPGEGPYAEVFMRWLKQPACDDPIWSPATDAEMLKRTVAQLEKYNVIGVLSADDEADLPIWSAAAPGRIIPSANQFDTLAVDAATVERMKALKAAGKVAVIGEIGTQYRGISPDDPRMDPFWAMAEELDLPVGIHVGPGPPGTPYVFDGLKGYRARHDSALTIENVLVKHPKLRVYLMHAGYPMLDDLLAVLYTHPHVYVDVGVIAYTQPRPAFYRYLQGIVDAGYGNRVMFGSDNMIWPEAIGHAVDTIEAAPFLDEKQKRGIFYDNAARFLRLGKEEIARHHAL